MSAAVTHKDGLEVRLNEQHRWQVFDTLTQRFVGSPTRSHHWARIRLDYFRQEFRPVIVRWMYGIPTTESYALGVEDES